MEREEIRRMLLDDGADVCGFAQADRFENAPAGFSPRDLFKGCQSVIAFGVALPKGALEAEARLIYSYYNAQACQWADHTAFRAAKALEERYGAVAVPVPSDGPYEYWEQGSLKGKGLLSMKHAAELCGLGRLGKSTLLLSPEYGNRLVVGAVLTDLPLESDELCRSICIPQCQKCLEGCPVHAIGEGRVDQKKCRPNAYGKTARGFDAVTCNRCRTGCPMKYGEGGKG